MKKTRFSITLLHKIIIGTMLLLAICLLFKVEVYNVTYEGAFAGADYSYLQPGDYCFEITYENGVEGEEFLVTTDYLVNISNQQGTLLGNATMEEPEGMIQFFVHFDIVNIGLHFFLKNVRPYAACCNEA